MDRRKKIVWDQSSHVWRHAGRCVHCSAESSNFFARHQQLIKSCDQDNFTGTVCNSARGVGLVFDQNRTHLNRSMTNRCRECGERSGRHAYWWRQHSLVKKPCLENLVGFGWGLSLMMLRCMPYMGLCFFQHPRIGQFLGGPCRFWLNYSDLGHCMASNLVWIWSAWRHLSNDV